MTYERRYSNFLTRIFLILNPLKKSLIKTQCQVHKYINIESILILRNDGYLDEFNFFRSYISKINDGAVWADQDFKSSNHFYNPHKNRGLFGRSDAMTLGTEYYNKSIYLYQKEEFDKAMFYLGASLHIIQDMTVPQHANIRLLDSHRQYETFIKRTYQYTKDFKVYSGAYILPSIEDYIHFNARTSMKIYRYFSPIKNKEGRYYKIAKCSLPLAKRTSAGAMLMFYNDLDLLN